MTHVTCRLTAKNWDQLWNPILGNGVWTTFTFLVTYIETLLRWFGLVYVFYFLLGSTYYDYKCCYAVLVLQARNKTVVIFDKYALISVTLNV